MMLEELGLNKTQIRVFEAIQRIGECGAQQLIKESGVASANIYPAIDSLVKLGLIAILPEGKHNRYAPSSSKAILALHMQKLEQISNLKPQLESYLLGLSQKKEVKKPLIQIFSNIAGIKSAISSAIEALPEDSTYYILGAPLAVNESLNGFFQEIHELRIKKNIKFKILYSPDNKEFSKQRKKLALTHVKILKQPVLVECAVYNDTVQIVFLGEDPKIIEITDVSFAKTIITYFELLWLNAETLS